MTPRIVIVGAGAAGVYTALRLRQSFGERCEIVLLERSGRVGGNAMAAPVAGVTVECGAQFFHRGAQASFVGLLDSLDLWESCRIVRTAAGFTIWDRVRRRRLLHLPATVAGFRSLGWGDWVRATKFGLFLAYCWALERWQHDWTVTVDAWLDGMRLLDHAFKRDVIKPFLYQFVSMPGHRIGEASAKYAVTYLVRTLFPGVGITPAVPSIGEGRPTFEAYQSLVGLHEVHRRVLAAADVAPRLDTAVVAIRHRRDDGKTEVVTSEETLIADHVVLATDPHVTAELLAAGGTAAPALVADLAALEYARLPISMQHGRPSHMPEHRGDWQPFNTIVDGDDLMFSVWFGPMRHPAADGTPIDVFKSWGSPRLSPARGADEFFAHQHFVPVPTAEFMATRDRVIRRWQGDRGLWLAGGWTRWFDSQEAALSSADAVAAGITRCRPVEEAHDDVRAELDDFLDRCSTHAPVEVRGRLAHATDEVAARG